MPHADPGIVLNCPRCPQRLAYIETLGTSPQWAQNTHIYACPEHGRWELLPELGLRPAPARTH